MRTHVFPPLLTSTPSAGAGPLATAEGLPCYFQGTDCVFSPNEQHVLTGLNGKGVEGKLVILDAETLTEVKRIGKPWGL